MVGHKRIRFFLLAHFVVFSGCTVKSLDISFTEPVLSVSEAISGEPVQFSVDGTFPPYTFSTSLGTITDEGLFTAPTVSESTPVEITITDARGVSKSKTLTVKGFKPIQPSFMNAGTSARNFQMQRVVQSSNGTLWAVGRYGREPSGSEYSGYANMVAVFKSVDEGISWITMDAVYDRYPSAIAVNPENPNHVIYAYQKSPNSDYNGDDNTGVSKIKQSLDGGETWSSLATLEAPPALSGFGSFQSVVVRDLLIHNSQIFVCGWVSSADVGTNSLPFVLRSSDGIHFPVIAPRFAEVSYPRSYLNSFYRDGSQLWVYGGHENFTLSFTNTLLMKYSESTGLWSKVNASTFNHGSSKIQLFTRIGSNRILQMMHNRIGIYDDNGASVSNAFPGTYAPVSLRPQFYQDSNVILIAAQNQSNHNRVDHLILTSTNQGTTFTNTFTKITNPANSSSNIVRSVRDNYEYQLSGPLFISKSVSGLYYYLAQECTPGPFTYQNCNSSKIARYTSIDGITWTQVADSSFTSGGLAEVKSTTKSASGDLYALLKTSTASGEFAVTQKSMDSGLTWQVIDTVAVPIASIYDTFDYHLEAVGDQVLISIGLSGYSFTPQASVLRAYHSITEQIVDLPKAVAHQKLVGSDSTGRTYFIHQGSFYGPDDGTFQATDFFVSSDLGATTLANQPLDGSTFAGGFRFGSSGYVIQGYYFTNDLILFDGSAFTSYTLPSGNYQIKMSDENSKLYFFDSSSGNLKTTIHPFTSWETLVLPAGVSASMKLFKDPATQYLYVTDFSDEQSFTWRSKDQGLTWFKIDSHKGAANDKVTNLMFSSSGEVLSLDQRFDYVRKLYGFFVRSL